MCPGHKNIGAVRPVDNLQQMRAKNRNDVEGVLQGRIGAGRGPT